MKSENAENNNNEAPYNQQNEQAQPKEDEKEKHNEDGPGILINQPLDNVHVPEQSSEQ